jgi:NADPH:quinone reductase-like Zn-dependent oxidoreductase
MRQMKAARLIQPYDARIESIALVEPSQSSILLKVHMVGLCGSDLNSFRGRNPMVRFPRILGHEVAATVVDNVQTFQRCEQALRSLFLLIQVAENARHAFRVGQMRANRMRHSASNEMVR